MYRQDVKSTKLSLSRASHGSGDNMKEQEKHEEETARMTLRLPQELSRQVKHAAIDANCTQQELVTRALRAYLAKGGHK
jgi:predicted HicB family RNase H-like nuclease